MNYVITEILSLTVITQHPRSAPDQYLPPLRNKTSEVSFRSAVSDASGFAERKRRTTGSEKSRITLDSIPENAPRELPIFSRFDFVKGFSMLNYEGCYCIFRKMSDFFMLFYYDYGPFRGEFGKINASFLNAALCPRVTLCRKTPTVCTFSRTKRLRLLMGIRCERVRDT